MRVVGERKKEVQTAEDSKDFIDTAEQVNVSLALPEPRRYLASVVVAFTPYTSKRNHAHYTADKRKKGAPRHSRTQKGR